MCAPSGRLGLLSAGSRGFQAAPEQELTTETIPLRKTAPLPYKRSFFAEPFLIFFLQDSVAFAAWHGIHNLLRPDVIPLCRAFYLEVKQAEDFKPLVHLSSHPCLPSCPPGALHSPGGQAGERWPHTHRGADQCHGQGQDTANPRTVAARDAHTYFQYPSL